MKKHPKCLLCENFFLTNDLYLKYGCIKYNIKSSVKKLPSIQIFEATNEVCPFFVIKKEKIEITEIDIDKSKILDKFI